MFLSLGLILLVGLTAGWLCTRMRLPALTGMIAAGILLGPWGLNLLDGQILAVSADLRKIALLIILSRAGLSLNLEDLRRAGRPAVLLSFVPACFEIAGMILLAPVFLGLDWVESALLGCVIAAVSPAVIVPRMLRLMNEKYGTDHAVPQMILAGASLDDIFVIVLFSIVSGMALSSVFDAGMLLQIPVSILLGIAGGCLSGAFLSFLNSRAAIRPVVQVLQFYAAAFLLTALESAVADRVPFSSLLAVMAMGMVLARFSPRQAQVILSASNSLWGCAEIFLFTLVGAEVSLPYAAGLGFSGVILLGLVLIFRMAGVWLSTLGSSLNFSERLFCMLAYTPKATVQAAIGAVPLSMGLACGQTVLTMAVLSILLTAPLGAWAIDLSSPKLLHHDVPGSSSASF